MSSKVIRDATRALFGRPDWDSVGLPYHDTLGTDPGEITDYQWVTVDFTAGAIKATTIGALSWREEGTIHFFAEARIGRGDAGAVAAGDWIANYVQTVPAGAWPVGMELRSVSAPEILNPRGLGQWIEARVDVGYTLDY